MGDGFAIFAFLWPIIATMLLMALGFTTGTIAARQQMADQDAREAALGEFTITNLDTSEGSRATLVTGSTVIGFDYFRRIALVLRKLIGGRFRMHENMMARARREAVLRMAERAREQGADGVHNVRLVSSNLANSQSAMGGCEVMAYGTAIWR